MSGGDKDVGKGVVASDAGRSMRAETEIAGREGGGTEANEIEVAGIEGVRRDGGGRYGAEREGGGTEIGEAEVSGTEGSGREGGVGAADAEERRSENASEGAMNDTSGADDVVDVVAAILWRGGRFLAALRPEGKPLAGYWEFPGGKVEPSEPIEAALARELAEELGARPLEWVFWFAKNHRYPHLNVRLHFFHVPRFEGEPRGMEGQEVAWFDPRQDFSGVNFLPVDRDIVAALKNLPYAEDLK